MSLRLLPPIPYALSELDRPIPYALSEPSKLDQAARRAGRAGVVYWTPNAVYVVSNLCDLQRFTVVILHGSES